MSKADAGERTGKSRSAIAISMLIILSGLVGISTLPTATALVVGDLGITDDISPVPDRFYTSYSSIELAVQLTNLDNQASAERILEWYACEGVKIVSQCISDSDKNGQNTITSLAAGEIRDHVFTGGGLVEWGANSTYTILYRFSEGDSQGGNDIMIYQFNLTTQFVDFEISDENPIDQIPNLAEYGNDRILNSNTDYNLTINFDFNSCGTCSVDATIGWELYSANGLSLISQANHTITMDSTVGVKMELSDQIPTFTHSLEGRYVLKYGLINSSGSSDMVPSNNIAEQNIVIDDTIDLVVDSMYPKNNPTSNNFYYGTQSLQATFSNAGNVSIYQPDVIFEIKWLNGTLAESQSCDIPVMHPGDTNSCIFDVNTYGDVDVVMRIQEIFDSGTDAKSSDNRIFQGTTVITGEILPQIVQSNSNGQYFSGGSITLQAITSNLAAKPVSFEWKYSALARLGTGQTITVNGSLFPHKGDYTITLYATDALGDFESASTVISILNSTDISNQPYFNGTAITRTEAYAESYFDYPIINGKYGAGGNLSPLRLMSFEMTPTQKINGIWVDTTDDLGLEFIEMEINLSKILPSNVPLESVKVRKLDAMNQTTWQEFSESDSFTLVNNDTMSIRLSEPANLLFVGVLPPPNVNPGELNITLLPAGQLHLSWEPNGDLDNPYFGQWNLYRITGSTAAGSYFPAIDSSTSSFTWSGLLENTKIASLDPTTSSWTDPSPLQDGICASYAIIPVDRTGVIDITTGAVSLDEEGNPGLTCGDSVVPQSQVTDLKAIITFDNSTSCHMKYSDWYSCYEASLSWTFPENDPDGNISWNLYRLDVKPTLIDLRFIDPIVTGIENQPGVTATYIDNGSGYDGIRPYRTYYYVLAPIDVIGNEATLVNYPANNIVRVHIDDEHWDFNSWRIPEPEPEPEPPMGSPWLGGLYDQMNNQAFQAAGLTMLGVIVLNFIGIPLLMLKNKKLKMKIKGKKGLDNDGDLEDELSEFFS